jgi:hypothetical protein
VIKAAQLTGVKISQKEVIQVGPSGEARLTITLDHETMELLAKFKYLTAHKNPLADTSSAIKLALKIGIDKSFGSNTETIYSKTSDSGLNQSPIVKSKFNSETELNSKTNINTETDLVSQTELYNKSSTQTMAQCLDGSGVLDLGLDGRDSFLKYSKSKETKLSTTLDSNNFSLKTINTSNQIVNNINTTIKEGKDPKNINIITNDLDNKNIIQKNSNNPIKITQSEFRRGISKSMKDAIFKRDKGQCQYQSPKTGLKCESKFKIEIDHIQPWSKGGKTTFDNLQCLCFNHNQLKTNLSQLS